MKSYESVLVAECIPPIPGASGATGCRFPGLPGGLEEMGAEIPKMEKKAEIVNQTDLI